MKGKIAFVLGAAVGYVLGTRAGRERYEQIKRGAETVWNTEPVQQGVSVVRGIVDERADEVKAFVRRATSDAFSTLSRQAAGTAKSATTTKSTGSASSSTSKPETTKPAPSPKAKSAAKPGAKSTAKPKPKSANDGERSDS